MPISRFHVRWRQAIPLPQTALLSVAILLSLPVSGRSQAFQHQMDYRFSYADVEDGILRRSHTWQWRYYRQPLTRDGSPYGLENFYQRQRNWHLHWTGYDSRLTTGTGEGRQVGSGYEFRDLRTPITVAMAVRYRELNVHVLQPLSIASETYTARLGMYLQADHHIELSLTRRRDRTDSFYDNASTVRLLGMGFVNRSNGGKLVWHAGLGIEAYSDEYAVFRKTTGTNNERNVALDYYFPRQWHTGAYVDSFGDGLTGGLRIGLSVASYLEINLDLSHDDPKSDGLSADGMEIALRLQL